MDPRGRVLGTLLRFDRGSVSSFVVDSLDLERGGAGFRRVLPNSVVAPAPMMSSMNSALS